MGDKEVRSFTVEPEIADRMRERDDVNWSSVISQFLQEFIASGQSTEAALAVRKQQIEDELGDARQRVQSLENELERIEEALSEKRNDRRDVFESFASLEMKGEVDTSNPAVQRHAEKLGMHPDLFLEKYRNWADE